MDISPSNYLMVEWILVAVCLIVIVARIAVRTWRRMWAFWLSDVLLIIAFLTFITLVIGDTWTFTRGQNDFNVFYTEGFTKWLFFADIVYDLGFYFPRFSLLAFYHELFPISEETLRKCSYAIAAYNVCAFITTAFIDLFWCGLDVSVNWKHDSTCTLLDAPVTLKINWTLGVVAELLVFVLPFGLLRRLKVTPRRDKIALACLFAIGFASILATVARLVFGILAVSSLTTYVIGSTEIATQIVVVGLPALRPLLRMIPKKNPSKSRAAQNTDIPNIEMHRPEEDDARASASNA
ncbi:hypothetical protein EDB81DRAFT_881616 [Dactylonectria macrodidyma]|uniref:Rhodopsin domain-containing protein n=1 Tax=Dactylonectria macrodidyma TaxID=307937 RepID=A0A9P9F3U9_9HYPO|nr:hypothetical protein EDB81DRAFT_881616 [Dactylonectria macrodidyma]